MNWLDIVIGGTVGISLFGALRNGLSREIIRLIALFAGIGGGMWWYSDLAAHLSPYIDSGAVASFAAFLAIVFGSILAGAVLAWGIGKALHWSGLRWFDRLLGGVFGLLRGLALAAALVLAVVAFPPTSGSAGVVAESRLAPIVFHGASLVTALAPARLRLAFTEGFQRVRGVWRETAARPSSKD